MNKEDPLSIFKTTGKFTDHKTDIYKIQLNRRFVPFATGTVLDLFKILSFNMLINWLQVFTIFKNTNTQPCTGLTKKRATSISSSCLFSKDYFMLRKRSSLRKILHKNPINGVLCVCVYYIFANSRLARNPFVPNVAIDSNQKYQDRLTANIEQIRSSRDQHLVDHLQWMRSLFKIKNNIYYQQQQTWQITVRSKNTHIR